MLAEHEVAEYLEEIREHVCSRCVERPPGGPPCAPLGKDCGVELHLPQLIESIHEVDSPSVLPYLEHNRAGICANCAFLHSSICPCPMDYLSALIVEAVERVDQRRAEAAQGNRLAAVFAAQDEVTLDEIERAYQEATGKWTGCDWPTRFGANGLDLQGMKSSHAAAIAAKEPGTPKAEAWILAARWLADVERYAAKAESEASMAVTAAVADDWHQALRHARRAWALEFASGRSLRNQGPHTWLNLTLIIDRAARASQAAERL